MGFDDPVEDDPIEEDPVSDDAVEFDSAAFTLGEFPSSGVAAIVGGTRVSSESWRTGTLAAGFTPKLAMVPAGGG